MNCKKCNIPFDKTILPIVLFTKDKYCFTCFKNLKATNIRFCKKKLNVY